MEKMGI